MCSLLKIPAKKFNNRSNLIVISSDLPYKDNSAQLTTAPLKPLSDQKCGRKRRFSDSKSIYFSINEQFTFVRESSNENISNSYLINDHTKVSRIPL